MNLLEETPMTTGEGELEMMRVEGREEEMEGDGSEEEGCDEQQDVTWEQQW